MDFIPQSSLFLGIIPALIIIYFSLKKYEGLYKDKTLFITFIAGIILGFIAAFVRVFSYRFDIIFIVVLAFFDQLFKTIILNIGRFQAKKETTIYGLSLGLGFGAAFTPFLIIALSSSPNSDAYSMGLVAIGSLGIILFHGATGAYIGYGVSNRQLIKHLMIAIIIQIPFNYLVDLMLNYTNSDNSALQIGFVVLLILYGFGIFAYVTKKIMPRIIGRKEKRKRSKS